MIFFQNEFDHYAICVNDFALHDFKDGLVQFYDGLKVIVGEKGQ